MASEYYKWLARNEKPEPRRELTPEEKRRVWWQSYKWYVAAALLCALLVGDFVYDLVQSRRSLPDYHIAYVGRTQLSGDTVAAIEEAFAALGQDQTGNGVVRVELRQYPLSTEDPTEEVMVGQDFFAGSSGTVQLLADLESNESVVFLLEDPEAFQRDYQILARVDGTLPEDTPDSDTPLYYRWSDCPVLAGLELDDGDVSGLYIARRGFWNGESSSGIAGAVALWELLTAGAE